MQILFLFITIVTFAIAIYFSINNRVKMIYFFLFMVMFQNIIVILFCRDIPPLYNTIFSVIKELMLYVALFFSIIKHGKIKVNKSEYSSILCLAVYFTMLAKNLLMTSAGMNSAILSLRYMLLPILCIYVGRNLQIKKEEYQSLLKHIISFSLILAVLGIIEMTIWGDSFWKNIGYSEYAVQVKGNPAYSLINGVTINFYTWDFWGIPVRRLVSITADPLATAFLIYLGALILMTGVVSLETNNGRITTKFVALIILFIASILTLSKAVFVLIALTILVCAYFYKWFPRSLLRIATFGFSILFFFILKSYVDSVSTLTSSQIHIMGLFNGIASSGLLGNGLGTAGASVAMLTNTESSVGESYIGILFVQVGIIGGLAILLFYVLQIKKLAILYSMYREKTTVLALVCLIGIIVCALFSESAVSMMGTGIYFIIIGISQQNQLYKTREYNIKGEL